MSDAVRAGAPRIKAPSLSANLWVFVASPWQSPPPEIGLDERVASVSIIRFYPDNKFIKLQCTVIEQNGKWTISDGANQRVFAGKWWISDSIVNLQYKLMSEEIKPANPKPNNDINLTVQENDGKLTIDGKLYESTNLLDIEEFDSHVGIKK